MKNYWDLYSQLFMGQRRRSAYSVLQDGPTATDGNLLYLLLSLKHHPEVELSLTHTISTETHCNDEPSQRYKSWIGSKRMVMKNNILDYSTLNILLQDMYTRIRFGLTWYIQIPGGRIQWWGTDILLNLPMYSAPTFFPCLDWTWQLNK